MGKRDKCTQIFGGENLKERGRLKDLAVDLSVILKLMFIKYGRRPGTDSSGSR
jgi:hypothetical protein